MPIACMVPFNSFHSIHPRKGHREPEEPFVETKCSTNLEASNKNVKFIKTKRMIEKSSKKEIHTSIKKTERIRQVPRKQPYKLQYILKLNRSRLC